MACSQLKLSLLNVNLAIPNIIDHYRFLLATVIDLSQLKFLLML